MGEPTYTGCFNGKGGNEGAGDEVGTSSVSEFRLGGGVTGGGVSDTGRGGSSPDFRENREGEYEESPDLAIDKGPEVIEVAVVR